MLVDEFMFVIASRLFPSECVLFTCNDGFIVRFELLAIKMSSKVSETRRKILTAEEKKKKYFGSLVTILKDRFRRKRNVAIEQGCTR